MKQVAQQEAEKARYLVETAEQMKVAAITTAEGDAQAAKLLAQVRDLYVLILIIKNCSHLVQYNASEYNDFCEIVIALKVFIDKNFYKWNTNWPC